MELSDLLVELGVLFFGFPFHGLERGFVLNLHLLQARVVVRLVLVQATLQRQDLSLCLGYGLLVRFVCFVFGVGRQRRKVCLRVSLGTRVSLLQTVTQVDVGFLFLTEQLRHASLFTRQLRHGFIQLALFIYGNTLLDRPWRCLLAEVCDFLFQSLELVFKLQDPLVLPGPRSI